VLFRSALIGLLALTLYGSAAAALNDSGQDTCYDGSSLVACDAANSGDAAASPRQDGRYGRDAATAAGLLSKTGGGAAAFDFSKLCMSGELAGQGSCPASPVVGSNADEWACTRDNVTNLVWSLDSPTYSWIDAGNTYPDVMNASSRCGYGSGWRLPTRRELLSLVHHGLASPAIDSAYFPGTASDVYWAVEQYSLITSRAWNVNFDIGFSNIFDRNSSLYVRLVRSGD
jgi:hypothetical protein